MQWLAMAGARCGQGTWLLTHTASLLGSTPPHLCPACHPSPLNQVTFVEALPNIMPGFDREIAKLAQRLLINGRPIDFHTNVIASKVTPGGRR